MTDRPILFSAPMVRAILREIEQPGSGKTATRRVLNPQPPSDMGLVGIYAPKLTAVFGYETPDADCKVPIRYMPGDRLYVREAHYLTDDGDFERIVCAVDQTETAEHLKTVAQLESSHPAIDWSRHKRLRPPMHMPRWASRITLIVSDVRVQRLQEISEDDAVAEGVERDSDGWRDYQMPTTQCCANARDSFRTLWDSLNAARGYGWDANPWIVAVSFTGERRNIDQVQP